MPWQNAATVGLQYYFSQIEEKAEYQVTISPDGFLQTYQELFQDPWNCDPHIPGSLQQPKMRLPFEAGKFWDDNFYMSTIQCADDGDSARKALNQCF
jgi:hypothetical protein